MALTRPQAAAKLGIGVRRLRDLERDGRLKPKGRKGKPRTFSEEQIEEFARSRRAQAAPVAAGNGKLVADGRTAAEVFRMLLAGKSKVDIVIDLSVTPDVVEQLCGRYNDMRRETSSDVVAPQCRKCREKPARFCGGCLDD